MPGADVLIAAFAVAERVAITLSSPCDFDVLIGVKLTSSFTLKQPLN
jgi:hypothetical protein